MANEFFDGVLRAVVIIVTLCVLVQKSMGNTTINTINIFAAAVTTKSCIMRGENRIDVIIR